jgi:molybdate transport system substrate-binding protein
MTQRIFVATFVASAALLTVQPQMRAEGEPVRVFLSNGFRAVFDDLAPACERSIGKSVTVQSGTSTSLIQRVNGGEAFDVAIMTTEAMNQLASEGKVTVRTPLGRSGIGIGSRAGTGKPPIGTAEELKKTLLAAKSVTYAGDGASRPHIERMMGILNIESEMTKKTLLEQGSVRAAAKVASGEAELLITLVSEILPAPGVQLVGALPAQFQNYVSFAAATGAKAANLAAGKSLISCLSGPSATARLKAKGMDKP